MLVDELCQLKANVRCPSGSVALFVLLCFSVFFLSASVTVTANNRMETVTFYSGNLTVWEQKNKENTTQDTSYTEQMRQQKNMQFNFSWTKPFEHNTLFSLSSQSLVRNSGAHRSGTKKLTQEVQSKVVCTWSGQSAMAGRPGKRIISGVRQVGRLVKRQTDGHQKAHVCSPEFTPGDCCCPAYTEANCEWCAMKLYGPENVLPVHEDSSREPRQFHCRRDKQTLVLTTQLPAAATAAACQLYSCMPAQTDAPHPTATATTPLTASHKCSVGLRLSQLVNVVNEHQNEKYSFLYHDEYKTVI